MRLLRGGLIRDATAALVIALALVLAPPPAHAAQPVARDVSSVCFPAATASFEDRPDGAAGAAVDCVSHFGIAQGTSPSTYTPTAAVTREQMASFLVRAALVAGLDVPAAPSDHFPDDEASVHELRVNQLFELGITTGAGDGLFHPTDPVSRGQMASFVARLVEQATGSPLPEPSTDWFADDDESLHQRRIDQLADTGIVQGVAEGQFAPESAVTRSQMALFLARTIDALAEDHGQLLVRIGVSNPTAVVDLLTVALRETTSTSMTVAFTFDERLVGATTEAFHLVGFEGDLVHALDVQFDAGDRRTVLARFDRATARLTTTATVEAAAVSGTSGHTSVEASAPLRTVDLVSGTTAGPDLFSISRLGAIAVDFNFDEPAYVRDGTQFHLVLDDGTVLTSDSNGNDGSQSIVVFFPGLTTTQADRVVRGYVDAGTVSDAATDGVKNPQQAVDVFATGVVDTRPDMLSVAVDEASDTATIEFDEPILVGASAIRLYRLDGSETSALAVTAVPAATPAAQRTTVVAQFPAGGVIQATGVSVDEGGVVSAASQLPNLVDEIGLPRSFAPGRTAAPDLVRAGRLEHPTADGTGAERTVTIRFDDPLMFQSGAGIAVVTPEGDVVPLTRCTATPPAEMRCVASPATEAEQFLAIGDAVLVSVDTGVVSDRSRSYLNYPATVPL